MKNYYAILGIKDGASLQEINKAYKERAKKWHPDFHPGDPECLEKIKDINEAYEILSHYKKGGLIISRLRSKKRIITDKWLIHPMRIILFSPIL